LAEIVLERVSKVFGAGVRAVDDVSLEIADGEFLVLVGPSGCGKSTLLRLIAGLEEATDGQIRIGDEDVTDKAPRDRDVAMVFQSYALYPHMTVRQNLGYGLKVRRTKKSEAAERVAKVARLLRLDDLLDRRPAELSGGQRQRVAMGRAIVREPKAFLMDEPLSNLDAKLRVGMRAELVSLHDRLGATTVYVTHDQVEAMTLGQRVAVMRDGRIQQVDTPQVLYRLPQTLFVAAFIGSPAMNLVEAGVEGGAVEFGGFRIPLPPLLGDTLPAGRVVLGVRPESFEDVAFADPSLPQIDVTVTVLEELGSDTHVIFPIEAPRVETDEIRETREGEDELLLAGDQAIFNARVDPRTAASPGSPLRLAVDPARFHFFDPESGENIGLRQEPSGQLGVERGDAREPLLDDRLSGRVRSRIPRDGG
jgi:multiple sugar transport system ATP-binding protein